MTTTPYVGYQNMIMADSGISLSSSSAALSATYPLDHLLYEDVVHTTRFPIEATKRITFVFSATKQPTLLVIDRRHNITAGVTVSLTNGTPGTTIGSATAVAGKPIVIKLASAPDASATWSIYWSDTSNVDGYTEIPYVYLGTYTELTNSFAEWDESPSYKLQEVESDLGNVRRLQTSGKMWDYQLPYDLLAADLAIWRAVRDYAVARPFVYALGGSHTPPDGVFVFQWMNAGTWSSKAKQASGSVKRAEISLRELPGGASQ